MVPGIVPVELVVARTDTQAVLVTDLRAYPTGLEFSLTGRPRPDRSGPPRAAPPTGPPGPGVQPARPPAAGPVRPTPRRSAHRPASPPHPQQSVAGAPLRR